MCICILEVLNIVLNILLFILVFNWKMVEYIIFPIIAAIAGVVVGDTNTIDIIEISILLIGTLLVILAIIYMIMPIFEDMVDKYKKILKIMRDDLHGVKWV